MDHKFKVIFYAKEDGTKPVAEFLMTLTYKMQAKISRIINLLEENGNMVREPDSKAIGDGLYEIRAKSDGNITRIIYFFYSHGEIILTNGFIKKSQKTPKKELSKAKLYRKDFLSRKGK